MALRPLAPCHSTPIDGPCALAVHVDSHGACLAQPFRVRRQQASLLLVAAGWNNETVHKVLAVLSAIEEQFLHAGDVLLPLLAWQTKFGVVLRCLRAGLLMDRNELAAVSENLLAGLEQWMLCTRNGSMWLSFGFRAGLIVLVGFLDQLAVLVARGSTAWNRQRLAQ